MTLTNEKYAELKAVAKPLIQWLNQNCHPHVHVVVTPTSAELSEGVAAIHTHEFVQD